VNCGEAEALVGVVGLLQSGVCSSLVVHASADRCGGWGCVAGYLSEKDRQLLVSLLKTREVGANQYIIRQGDVGTEFFILKSVRAGRHQRVR
jgi:hypothetical protein